MVRRNDFVLFLVASLFVFMLTACQTASPSPIPTASPLATAFAITVTPALNPSPANSPEPPQAPSLPPISPTLILHGDSSRPLIALTFDACQDNGPVAGYDEAVIIALTATRTPATLFLGGLWMQYHPAQTHALAANPLFELGNHAWSHPNFIRLKPQEMSEEILRTQHLLYTLTGRQTTLFRFPFDVYTDESMAVAGQLGLRVVSGDVASGDPDPDLSPQAIVKGITDQVNNGSIIIMHMNERGWRTAETLPALIHQLREKGYTFVTVSKLLEVLPK
jgi:peptidoglycan-N-acetylglucosamine deacetylase